ncbi:response regulator [Emticicia sp. 17c]|uniref:response regulator n=1 Tax=Emticicia sp. 17c TaxID=3127704 RepID=UPI00301E08C4
MYVSLNVVLAEDDAEYQQIFQDALDEVNIPTSLTIVSDGQELMDKLKAENSPKYNIVVLDMNMPKKDGIECLQEIRQDEKLNSSYSVVLTGYHNKTLVEKAYKAGANLFLTKPDSYHEYIEIVRKILTSEWQLSLPIFF